MRAMALVYGQNDEAVNIPARQYVGGALHELGEFDRAAQLLTANVVGVPLDAPGQPYGMAGLPAVFCRATRAWLYEHTGNLAQAKADAQDALRIARAAESSFSVMSATFSVASLHLSMGEFDAAGASLGRALELCAAHRLHMWRPILEPMYAIALARCAQSADALKLADRTMSRLGGSMISTSMMLRVAETYAATGYDERAARLAASALRRARNLGERTWEAAALWLVGNLRERAQPADLDGAQAAYRAGLRLAEQLGMLPLVARCRLGLASSLAQRRPTEAASEYAQQAVDEFSALELPYWAAQARELHAALAAAR
jgi:tetratricopeptide (TPR) repeat protein